MEGWIPVPATAATQPSHTVPASGAGATPQSQHLPTLSGWGRVPVVPGREVRDENLRAITATVGLTRGLGRAYGDAALPAPGDLAVAGSTLADRLLDFNPQTGELVAEAGFSLDQLYRVFLPRGWFTPVSPGTRFVTLGGMVAADVHGKNHHRAGCFGEHVTALTLRTADGSVLRCARDTHADLFLATLGGMGLTGHILDVTVRLERVASPWILQETERIDDIETFVIRLKDAGTMWPMTAGWVDCLPGRSLGRGILYRGRWAEPHEAPTRFPTLPASIPVPFMLPQFVLSRSAVRLHNTARFLAHRPRQRRGVVHPKQFFYPLDVVDDWHRLYGRSGFIQYQCVLPDSAPSDAARRLLELVARHGPGVFLCVIKDCGPEGSGLLSFPRPGMSFALDIPMRVPATQSLTDRLNEFVIAHGGRVYLAKDALTRPEHFRAMEPRLERFLAVRRRWDPQGRIRSAQSVRLFGW
jgi:decaprenylphospho-beta-D-ribofuranose 2-oxidase